MHFHTLENGWFCYVHFTKEWWVKYTGSQRFVVLNCCWVFWGKSVLRPKNVKGLMILWVFKIKLFISYIWVELFSAWIFCREEEHFRSGQCDANWRRFPFLSRIDLWNQWIQMKEYKFRKSSQPSWNYFFGGTVPRNNRRKIMVLDDAYGQSTVTWGTHWIG